MLVITLVVKYQQEKDTGTPPPMSSRLQPKMFPAHIEGSERNYVLKTQNKNNHLNNIETIFNSGLETLENLVQNPHTGDFQ